MMRFFEVEFSQLLLTHCGSVFQISILDLERIQNDFGPFRTRIRVFFLWLGAGLEEEKDDFVGLWIVIQDIPDSMSPGNANQAITKLLIQYK